MGYIYLYMLLLHYLIFLFILIIMKPIINNTLVKYSKKNFGHGPFNPFTYRSKLVNEKFVTTEEKYYYRKREAEFNHKPMYSMRHVHPIRQSGPIPPFAGPYNMEDARKAGYYWRKGVEGVAESTDIEELMRRIPGLTKSEAMKIQSLGLSPWEELDYAYICVNNGIDIHFNPNFA